MDWISVKDQEPGHDEPIVCCWPKNGKKWYVDVAYRTVSGTWNPEMHSNYRPDGFTHWMPLPPKPVKVSK